MGLCLDLAPYRRSDDRWETTGNFAGAMVDVASIKLFVRMPANLAVVLMLNSLTGSRTKTYKKLAIEERLNGLLQGSLIMHLLRAVIGQ